ncbi:MAG: hypothetical protein IK084_00330 [Bacteroidaceae bacterium]|nr:hypothetical protein [Bacteroidaceae bacterium]
MTQQEKQLLLKDLSARLPYSTKAPDKVYIFCDYEGNPDKVDIHSLGKHSFEYIRKEALLDILNDAIKYLSDGSLTGYYESMAYQDIIDKLNSM